MSRRVSASDTGKRPQKGPLPAPPCWIVGARWLAYVY